MRKSKTAEQRARILEISRGMAEAEQPAKRSGAGRPKGKRSNADYQSVTTFLHKQTYLDTQRALIGTGQDFGDLVDSLLADWLKGRG